MTTVKFLLWTFFCGALFLTAAACDDPRVEGTEPGDCNDGADNDGDTFFDCDDDSCAQSSLCAEGADGGPSVDSGPIDGGADTPITQPTDGGVDMVEADGGEPIECVPLERELERTLTLEDEFDGPLDTSVWNTEPLWGRERVINEELQYYHERAVTTEGGNLILRADRKREGESLWNDLQYTSGIVASFNKFTQQYGYFEARMRLPRGTAMWSAFWLLPKLYAEGNTEIDVIEVLGHEPRRQYFTYHYHNGADELISNGEERTTFDVSEDFHTYAVDWRPDMIIWYVDGVEQRRLVGSSVPRQEMFLLANLAIGGWTGAPRVPGGDTVFPTDMRVDAIRAYAYPESLNSERAARVTSGFIDVASASAGDTVEITAEILPRFTESGMRGHLFLYPPGGGMHAHLEQFDVDLTACAPTNLTSSFVVPDGLAPGEYFMSVGLFSGDYRRTIFFENEHDTITIE